MAEATKSKTEGAAKKTAAAPKAAILGKQGKADLPKAIFTEPFHDCLLYTSDAADE